MDPILLYWAGIVLMFGSIIYALAHEPADDGGDQLAHGDIPFLPDEVRALHSACVTEKGQHNHGF